MSTSNRPNKSPTADGGLEKKLENSVFGEPNSFPATISPQFVDGEAVSQSPQLADVSRILRLSVCLRVRHGGPDVCAGGGRRMPFLPVSTRKPGVG